MGSAGIEFGDKMYGMLRMRCGEDLVKKKKGYQSFK